MESKEIDVDVRLYGKNRYFLACQAKKMYNASVAYNYRVRSNSCSLSVKYVFTLK